MRVVIIGATGNIGTSVLARLQADPAVDHIVGIARRRPDHESPKTTWVGADVVTDDLVPHLHGADAVVHLTWQIQPSRDEAQLWRVNVEGTQRVLDAVGRAGVGTFVYASSVGAYSPGRGAPVDESWPTHGIPTSAYSRQKAYTERQLDAFEATHADRRVVRIRPALVFKAASGPEVRRYFLGPFVPRSLVQRRLIPIVPDIPHLRFQCVHADDVAEVFRLAVTTDVRGALNVASEPVLDARELARALGAHPVPVPSGPLRSLASLTWRLHLQPTEPGWLDLALESPVLDTTRVRTELGWAPTRDTHETLRELLEGIHSGEGSDTPVLHGDDAATRASELTSRVGAEN